MNWKLKILVFLICVGITIPKDVLLSIGQVPILMEHYMEHHKENEKLGFIDFLMLHYDNAEHYTQDYNKHNQLPFCHHHTMDCFAHVSLLFFNDSVKIVFIIPHSTADKLPIKQYCSISGFSPSIWQPPKIS